MSTFATPDDLERLGLSEFRLGDSVELSWPTSDTSQALGAGVTRATFAAMLAVRFVNVPFAAVSDPALGRFQLELSQTPTRVLKVSAPREADIQLYALRGSHRAGETTYTPPEDAGTIYIDAENLPDVILRAGEAGLAMRAGGQALELVELLKPIELRPLERLEPPVMDWVQDLDDAWLFDQLTARAHAHNSWTRVVAAGMLARLPIPGNRADVRVQMGHFIAEKQNLDYRLEAAAQRLRDAADSVAAARLKVKDLTAARLDRNQRSDAVTSVRAVLDRLARDIDSSISHWMYESRDLSERVAAASEALGRLQAPQAHADAHAWVENFVSGKVIRGLAAPRRWMRTLDAQQTRTIEQLSLAEVDALYEAVEVVASDVDLNAPNWLDEWRDLCYRRDDLECVLVLLDEIDKAINVRRSLAGLDKEGDLLRLSVPLGTLQGDERARRAALKNPGSWWSAPANQT